MNAPISSRDNATVKHLVKLGDSRAYRREAGQYLCEGHTLLREALLAGRPDIVVSAEGTALPALPPETKRVILTERLFTAVSPLDTPQGVLCVCPIPKPVWPETPRGRFLLLDRIQDPGNVGAILRTGRAFGLAGVLLTPGCADPYSPKTSRGAMGALFTLPVWELPDPAAFLQTCGLRVLGTALDGESIPLPAADFCDAVTLLGNEAAGVSPALLALCRQTVKIPMEPACQSLGVASAAAVILWQGYANELTI